MGKDLKVIECPNCLTKFNSYKKFSYDKKSKKFTCSKCNYTFLYPADNYAWPWILFGALSITIIPGIVCILMYDSNWESSSIVSSMIFINGFGLYFLIWGIKASIEMSKLKRLYPDWNIRRFNTLNHPQKED